MKRSDRRRHAAGLLLIPLLGLSMAAPTDAAAQAPTERALERLAEVLPPEVVTDVMERVEQARARGLPEHPLTDIALEGVMKGRTGAEALAAVDALLVDLERADGALRSGNRAPEPAEVEAAAVALRMGVDGEALAALARSGPAGRSLSVPLLVMGGLSQRGLPADQALDRVLQRLADRADDAALVGELGPVPGGRAGGPPADVLGPGGLPARGLLGPGVSVPVGPPDAVGAPDGRPGRGGPPDTPRPGPPGGS